MANPQEIVTITPTSIEQKPTRTGKTFWAIKTTEGISASIWKEDIAKHIELNLMQPVTVAIERNGEYTNVVGRAPSPDTPPPGDNFPDPVQAPVAVAPVAPVAAVAAPAAARPAAPVAKPGDHLRGIALTAAASFHNSTTDELADVIKTADLMVAYLQGVPMATEHKSSTEIDNIPDDLAPERFVQK